MYSLLFVVSFEKLQRGMAREAWSPVGAVQRAADIAYKFKAGASLNAS
jgi:hypothetical protein